MVIALLLRVSYYPFFIPAATNFAWTCKLCAKCAFIHNYQQVGRTDSSQVNMRHTHQPFSPPPPTRPPAPDYTSCFQNGEHFPSFFFFALTLVSKYFLCAPSAVCCVFCLLYSLKSFASSNLSHCRNPFNYPRKKSAITSTCSLYRERMTHCRIEGAPK